MFGIFEEIGNKADCDFDFPAVFNEHMVQAYIEISSIVIIWKR